MKWYSAWSGVSRAIGGITPDASQVSRMMFFGWPAALLRDGVADELERVRGARVLGERVVVEVDHARDRVEDDVLEDRAEAAACVA